MLTIFFFSVGKVVRYNTTLARFRDNPVYIYIVVIKFFFVIERTRDLIFTSNL